MDFFNDCKTQEEAKSTFKRLCKHFHPDKGGEESLMIELTKQYEAWTPSYEARGYRFNFLVNGGSNVHLNGVYEQKISELNALIYHLRHEIEFESKMKKHYQREMNNNQDEIDLLKVQLTESKILLSQERDKHKNRSLADKIKTVFGYE